MTEQTGEKGLKEYSVRYLFDQILAKHMERLIGSRYGIDKLPLNLATLSSLILLAKREKEIKKCPSSAPERYDKETLFKELYEMGLEKGEYLEKALDELIQKSYIDVNVRYRFKARKPTLGMTDLLDRTFPNLPGLNLVAHFIQTIDDIQSDRKDIPLEVAQIDRMLQKQGLSIKKQRERLQQKKKPKTLTEKEVKFSEPTVTPTGDLRSVIKSGLKVSDIYQFSETEADENADPATSTVPVNRDSEGEQPFTGPGEEHPGNRPLDSENVLTGAPAEDLSGALADRPDDEGSSGPSDIDPPDPQIKALEDPEPGIPSGIEREDDASEKDLEVLTDDFIQSQIADFEERLSMACPLCSTGKILETETAKGKTYYHCSSGNCNFISWGQPYHIECPLCKNLFLIENVHKTGKRILKCPRATCRYWQDIPFEAAEPAQMRSPNDPKSSAVQKKPQRKVRRRRVLRRKR